MAPRCGQAGAGTPPPRVSTGRPLVSPQPTPQAATGQMGSQMQPPSSEVRGAHFPAHYQGLGLNRHREAWRLRTHSRGTWSASSHRRRMGSGRRGLTALPFAAPREADVSSEQSERTMAE